MGDRKCPICNSDKKTKIGDINLINFDNEQGIFDHQTISKCEKCGSVFHEGIDMSLLDAHYAQYTGGSDVQKMTEDELVLNNNMANFIESHLNISKDAYILDVGCGYGWVIELLSDRGYKNIVGMDTDEPLMKKLQEQGYNVEVGSVYSQNREDLNGKYDVVILKMVMEHLENPYSAVENVRKWMNTNGVLVIEVPDCSLYDETAFFPGYFQSVNMEHINNFSLLSMTNMMKDWRVVASESTNSNGIFPVLRMAFRYDKGFNSSPSYNYIDEKCIVNSIDRPSKTGKMVLDRIEKLNDKKCVVWGVSAFTRGLLTYTELKNKDIVCFVDKNPMLQQKKLLGKPIVAPEKLEDFEGVIVIPGKNSEQAIKRNIVELGYKNEIICLS